LPDAYTSPGESPHDSVAPPPALVRALAGVARHEAAIRAYQSSLVRQLEAEARWRSAAAERRAQRAEREEDRATREADQGQREAARFHRAALRAELEHYVRGLKRGGVPPERMLVVVKSLVADTAKATEPRLPETGALTQQVVQWSLDAYYSAA
jgi:hypothetical protein